MNFNGEVDKNTTNDIKMRSRYLRIEIRGI
nr:MAG TPA: hypothetical protein [Caudoviricetes sp.]